MVLERVLPRGLGRGRRGHVHQPQRVIADARVALQRRRKEHDAVVGRNEGVGREALGRRLDELVDRHLVEGGEGGGAGKCGHFREGGSGEGECEGVRECELYSAY